MNQEESKLFGQYISEILEKKEFNLIQDFGEVETKD